MSPEGKANFHEQLTKRVVELLTALDNHIQTLILKVLRGENDPMVEVCVRYPLARVTGTLQVLDQL